MNDDNEEAESKRQYILTLCSAIGGIEEVKQDDGTIEQIYCVGDESLGKCQIRIEISNIHTNYDSMFERFEKSDSFG